jgi:hypothetical protein
VSGPLHDVWAYRCTDGGRRVCVAVYRRMSASQAEAINQALAGTAAGVRVEHAGHGRYDLVSAYGRERIGIGSPVSVRSA